MRPVVAAVALLALAVAQLVAQTPQPEIWVGVLTYDGPGHLPLTSESGAVLRPVSAFINGTWRSDPDTGEDQLESRESGSVRWLPAGRDLPRSWVGWFIDGRQAAFTISGPSRATGAFDIPGVAAGVRPPPPVRDAWSDDIVGVAVAGRVVVHPFVDVEGRERGRISDVMRRAMVTAEAKAIATRAATAREQGGDAAPEIPLARLAAAAYDIDIHRTARLAGGARTIAFEGTKILTRGEGCHSLRSGVAVEQSGAGRQRVLGAWTYLICDELFIAHAPLAVLERNGRSCWVSEYRYEDGVRYVLMPTGTVDDESTVSRCPIRD